LTAENIGHGNERPSTKAKNDLVVTKKRDTLGIASFVVLVESLLCEMTWRAAEWQREMSKAECEYLI
jgi:hypothetical protein